MSAPADMPRIDVWATHPGRAPHLRAHLVALAEYLTGLTDYPDPWEMVHTLVPWVPAATVEDWLPELLRLAYLGTEQADQHWLGEVLDYLTGVR